MNNSPIQYSSYTRTILADLECLATLIRKYAATQQSLSKRVQPGAFITLEEVQTALMNPQNAIKPAMASFAKLLKIEQDIIRTHEEIMEQRETIRETIRKLHEKQVMATDPLQKDRLTETLKEMEIMLQKTNEVYQNLARSQNELQAEYDKIDQTAMQHDEQWDKFRTHNLQVLLHEIKDNSIDLTEMEQKNLLQPDTWPQIIQDFHTLNIPVPNYLNIISPNYETYFKLKAYLAIHSSLSRRMQPHTEQDILRYLKKLLRG